MATLRVSVALDPARLLSRAVDGLFPLAPSSASNPWPTLSSWLVLRQGGLRDDLHRLAAEHGVAGWYDPPVCLFAELASRWSRDQRPALTNQERLALLTTLLARHGSGVFDRAGGVDAWVPSVDRLVGELVSEGVTSEAFTAALEGQHDRDAFELGRDTALATIYTRWTANLAELQRLDGRDALVRLAREIEADPDGFAARLGGRRDIRIVGLADLRGGWRRLLASLKSTPVVDCVTIFASHAIELPASLGAELIADDAAPTMASVLFSDATAPLQGLTLLEAPDAAREVELVAVRVRALLDSGVAPTRVAVVAREARPGVDQLAEALERLGVPVTARRRTALAQTGPARALHALLAAAAQDWTRHSVVELAEHPLLGLGLDASVLNFVGMASPTSSYDGWEQALSDLDQRCRKRDDGESDDHRRPLPATDRVQQTLAAWRAWGAEARRLAKARTSAEWFGWVIEVLMQERWKLATALDRAPAGEYRVWRADFLARDKIAELAAAWQEALATFDGGGALLDAEQFAGRLALVLDEDLITQPETGFGVVVAEALAAGWRAFDHLFLLGLAAGEFPLSVPRSPVFGERERRAVLDAGISLDPPDQWLLRERELFRVLCAAPRDHLTLSWPAMDAEGREVARSAFVDEVVTLALQGCAATDEEALRANGTLVHVAPEQVVTEGYPVVARNTADVAVAHARRVAAIERERARTPSPWNGSITDEELVDVLAARFGEQYQWSATQLEELAKCSWNWFAHHVLRLEQREEADDSIEPTEAGIIQHDALHRFFEAAGEQICKPVHLLEEHRAWAEPMLDEALDAAWNEREQQAWLGAPALRPVALAELRHQLQGYLSFEIELNEKSRNKRTNASKQIRMGAERGELSFDHVQLDGGGVPFLLRGMIDRVDRGVDERVPDAGRYIAAIDYKSTKYATPAAGKPAGWADGVVLQVPLYAAVLRTLFPDDTLARLEYRTLRDPALVHQLEFTPLGPVQKGTEERVVGEDPETEEKLRAAIDVAGQRISSARLGQLPAAPKKSTGCSPYCPARDICRVPGGPEEAQR